MSSNLSIIPPAPGGPGSDGGSSSHPNPRRPQPAAPEAEPAPVPDVGQRLIIEQDERSHELVYTVIDRASGEVVARTPRDEVARMADKPSYAAGALIRAKI
jgi:hypothetical protein